MADNRDFLLQDDFITLGQLLKAVDAIGSGGEVKQFLYENVVEVNGEEESRRGRKLYPGDLVVLPGGSTISVK